MNQDMENIKEQLEEVIKKNLPQSIKLKEDGSYYMGFKDCVDNINTSLIADEVLKVVGEKIKEEVEKYEPAYESEDKAIVSFGKQLLSNLSTNKENKNND